MLGRFPAQLGPTGLGKGPGWGPARFAQIFSPVDQVQCHSVRLFDPPCDCIGVAVRKTIFYSVLGPPLPGGSRGRVRTVGFLGESCFWEGGDIFLVLIGSKAS